MCAVTPDVCGTHGSPCAQMAHTGMPLTHFGSDVCHAVDPENILEHTKASTHQYRCVPWQGTHGSTDVYPLSL
jgi:hypothetical protein